MKRLFERQLRRCHLTSHAARKDVRSTLAEGGAAAALALVSFNA